MKIVYIAGPFRASSSHMPGHQDMFEVQKNVMRAMELGLAVALRGAFPLIPHANTMFFTGSAPDRIWLEGDLELLRRSDALLTVDGWKNSSGAWAEVSFAKENNIPVFHDISDLDTEIVSSTGK